MHRAVRLVPMSLILVTLLLLSNSVAFGTQRASASGKPLCEAKNTLCTDPYYAQDYEGNYVGHDEPSLLFYSNVPGSGNNSVYRVVLPKEPPTLPKQDGSGGTFNFQLHPALWFGMALCDTQSYPEYTHVCTPDSDANIFNNPNPAAPDYIGKHPGSAFMELQFYPPGWVLWPPGVSCDATQWCAAMAIFSLSQNANTGQINNTDCLNKVGIEPANFAFITKDGKPVGPPDPLGLNDASFTPDPHKVLFMNAGDRLIVDIHDTREGLLIEIRDLTTGTSGRMKASIANGFAQTNFEPNATTCSETPYAFHPMYATSSEDTRVPWAAHSYNVAFSDEIGHFEFCDAATGFGGSCTKDGVGDKDATNSGTEDDVACFVPPVPAAFKPLVQIGGCIGTDADFDGVSYQPVWPGSTNHRSVEQNLHPEPFRFTSPVFNGNHSYNRVAFEADLPRIEDDTKPPCNRTTGANCVNPPVGANFYPIFTTGKHDGRCIWQLGGVNIPGTTNTFGGTSTAEYGPLLLLTYAGPAGPFQRYNNFRQVLPSNPCVN